MREAISFDDYQELLVTLDECDRFHDERRSSEWLELFAEGAVYVVHGQRYVGRNGLARFLSGRRDGAGKHLHSAPIVINAASSLVELECDYVGYRRAAGQIVIGGAGRYHDRLRRDSDRWRFVERRIEGTLLSDDAIQWPKTPQIIEG